MKVIKTIPMCILLFTGYLCNAQDEGTPSAIASYTEAPGGLSPPRVSRKHSQNSTASVTPETDGSDRDAAGSRLPGLVVAGVSIALVLLFVLIVGVYWYAWKKSQEGSIEINPIPHGEAGVSLRAFPVPQN